MALVFPSGIQICESPVLSPSAGCEVGLIVGGRFGRFIVHPLYPSEAFDAIYGMWIELAIVRADAEIEKKSGFFSTNRIGMG
jgi:hypothetical protein